MERGLIGVNTSFSGTCCTSIIISVIYVNFSTQGRLQLDKVIVLVIQCYIFTKQRPSEIISLPFVTVHPKLLEIRWSEKA